MSEGHLKEKKEKVFKYRGISLVCLYSSIVTAIFGFINPFFLILPAALIIAFLVLNFLYWKCPYCDTNFEMRHGATDGITHCPYCGEKLRDN